MKTKKWLAGLVLIVPLALLSVVHGQEPPGGAANAPDAVPVQQTPLPPGATEQKDIEYVPNGGASRTLDLYLPNSSGKPVPLVIFVHGGGWHSGSKDGNPAKFLVGGRLCRGEYQLSL